MKEIWIRVQPWKKETVINALETGADAVIIPPGKSEQVKQLGVLKTVAEDGDLKLGEDVFEVDIQSPEDQEKIIQMDPEKMVIIKTSDWSIIPLENILARRGNVMAEVEDLDQARLFSGVLERGVDGVVVSSDDRETISGIVKEIKGLSGTALELVPAVVKSVKPLGMGDRVCVDTCSLLETSQGLLIGNSSQNLFLVHAENVDNPYVSQRPFRVNAGAVHAYVQVPGGRTRYLSELEAGDEVLAVNHEGQADIAVVGRVKIEKRPLLLVTAEAAGRTLTTVLQNAETIRLTAPDGSPVSVVDLKVGHEILVVLEEGGRHFGHKIEESIVEQ